MEDFLKNRYQRVVLNRQVLRWARVNAGVPQGSILGPLLFLICIKSKLFADDTSLFSVVLDKANNWAYQWKMSFNPDPSKRAQEVIFSRKIKKPSHPNLIINNNRVLQTLYQKTSRYLFR